MFSGDYFNKLSELVEKAKAPNRHRARSAINHIKKALLLKDIDPSMAVFRIITAEEEAATGIILSIKSKRYQGAEKLNHRNHLHKNSLYPFLQAMKLIFIGTKDLPFKLALSIETYEGKEIVRIRLTPLGEGAPQGYIYPIPPLNFVLGDENKKPLSFEKQFYQLASDKNFESIKKYLESVANQRNEILYASDKGIPEVGPLSIDFITKRQQRIGLLLSIYLMIDEYQEHQSFVQNSLNGFLKMIDAIPRELAERF